MNQVANSAGARLNDSGRDAVGHIAATDTDEALDVLSSQPSRKSRFIISKLSNALAFPSLQTCPSSWQTVIDID